MKPEFYPGKNIALKTPAHEYDSVISFYKEMLGFQQLPLDNSDSFESVCFAFGDKVLWVDKIESISQSEVWLEITSSDVLAAQEYLKKKGCIIRNEIERLPENFQGFWLSSPSNIIHLVTEE
jgi:predicted enzyme related to lactoylglutathione lyase